MEEEGLAVDCVAGTSMGAVVGGLYAAGMNSADIGEAVSSLDLREVMVGDIPRNELYIGEKRWGERTNAQFYFDDDWTPRLPRGLRNGQHIMDARLPWRATTPDRGLRRSAIPSAPWPPPSAAAGPSS
jgi:NTE family protein